MLPRLVLAALLGLGCAGCSNQASRGGGPIPAPTVSGRDLCDHDVHPPGGARETPVDLVADPGPPLQLDVGEVVDATNDPTGGLTADEFTAPNSSEAEVVCRIPPASDDSHTSRFQVLRSGSATLSSSYIQTCGPCSQSGLLAAVVVEADRPR